MGKEVQNELCQTKSVSQSIDFRARKQKMENIACCEESGETDIQRIEYSELTAPAIRILRSVVADVDGRRQTAMVLNLVLSNCGEEVRTDGQNHHCLK